MLVGKLLTKLWPPHLSSALVIKSSLGFEDLSSFPHQQSFNELPVYALCGLHPLSGAVLPTRIASSQAVQSSCGGSHGTPASVQARYAPALSGSCAYLSCITFVSLNNRPLLPSTPYSFSPVAWCVSRCFVRCPWLLPPPSNGLGPERFCMRRRAIEKLLGEAVQGFSP